MPLKESGRGRVQLAATISFIRADRRELANSYRESIAYSWDADAADRKHLWDDPPWLANPGDDFYMEVHIARDPDSREVLSEDEQEPYGMKTRSTAVNQPVALLRQAAEKP